MEDINLNADYSDDDTHIYFSGVQLMEYLRYCEEDNVFRIV